MGEVNLDLDQDQEAVLVLMVEVKDHLLGSCLSFNLFNQFMREKSIPGRSSACFIGSLANFFPQHQVL